MSDKKTTAAEGELNLDGLETAGTTATEGTEKAARVAKELTAEDIAGLAAGVDKMKELGVSDNFAKVLGLVTVWHDKVASAPVKEAITEAFGGADKFKDYIDGEFQTELSVFLGLQKSLSVLNNIKSFYARRAGAVKVKFVSVSIGGEFYDVNAEYMASIKDKDAVEKRELLLAHADTKKNASVEVL
jgi:hypothetical protein